jgi:uncharacterized protein
MRRTMLFAVTLFAAVALASGPSFAADPSLHEVYQAVEAGHLKEAEGMMDKVLHDHPNSAKAHFVEAEILAKDGQPDKAKSELAIAERTSPGLPFAKATSVDALKARIAAPTHVFRPAVTAEPVVSTHPVGQLPWGTILMVLALILAAVFFFRSLNRPRTMPAGGSGYMSGGNTFGSGGYPQPTGPGGMGPVGSAAGGGIGSGILGGLATGAAVGAGMVAGEALMHRIFSDGSNHLASDTQASSPLGDPLSPPDTSFDAGGNDFGVSDGGSWDDSSSNGSSDDWS